MNNRHFLPIILFMICIITPKQATAKFSFQKIKSLLDRKRFTTSDTQKYTAPASGTFKIATYEGNIVIKTNPTEKEITCTSTKRSSKKDTFNALSTHESQSRHQLSICSTYDPKEVYGAIDYEITVPAHVQIQATTHKGSITMDHAYNPAYLTAHNGSIQVDTVHKQMHAATRKHGDITINRTLGNTYASTEYGTITVYDAHKDVHAKTKKGFIDIAYAHVPATSAINLHADNGSINLALPSNTNATIKGHTKRGIVTSDHYITLKERVTRLDRKAWKQFRKEMNGIIGTGEAVITLSSLSGNLKISQTQEQA